MADHGIVRGTRLDQLLEGIVGTLAEVRAAPPGGDRRLITGVAILDPDDEFGDHPGELVLVIGARGRQALEPLRSSARRGAGAVAVKAGTAAEQRELADAAAAAGVALLVVAAQARWDQLASVLRDRLDVAELAAGPTPGVAMVVGEDLFALAEVTALVTGGIVSIEDPGNRVLAYSRSDDRVDELRRLSILGWQGPESYMRMLRDWGVLDQLRGGERVVRVEAHPELGIRARLAIGIRAGSRYLGTIWVQQRYGPGAPPFSDRAEEALVGAARLAASEILRRRAGVGPVPRSAQLGQLLTGRANTDLAAGRLGLDPAAPALVIAFGGPAEPDAPAAELHRDQLRSLVSVYATAYHRGALVADQDERIYVLLSGLRGPAGPEDPMLRTWAGDAVRVAAEQTGVRWRAGISAPVPRLAGLAGARAEADRVLDALTRSDAGGLGVPSVAGIAELRVELLFGEVDDLLSTRPELRIPGVTALLLHDQDRSGSLAESLLAYLDALGDVRTAASGLRVHPNTLRHRVRRARAISGVDLDHPAERLAAHLQLLVAARTGRITGPPTISGPVPRLSTNCPPRPPDPS